MKDCTTCKYGFVDEQLGFPMCHHPSRRSEDCVDFNMHEEVEESAKATGIEEKKLPEGLEEAAEKSAALYYAGGGYSPFPNIETAAHKAGFKAGAEWGASHAVAPHYFELRELKTGRVFLAEWSDMAGEWYERGNGRAHQSDEVEIVQRDKKTPTP